MRLDKLISETTHLSRTEAKKAIKSRRVTVNGLVAGEANLKVTEHDQVILDNQPLQLVGKRYFMLNKPAGYLCANKDPHHPTVFELLQEPKKHQLHIAGRLDLDTTGLVLITDDGQWSHRVTSPNKALFKRYHVSLADPINQNDVEALQQGIWLKSEKNPTKPAQVELLDPTHLYLAICEGKYHQVKRMLAALGNRVIALHRDKIGPLSLEHLEPGNYRPLSEGEIEYF